MRLATWAVILVGAVVLVGAWQWLLAARVEAVFELDSAALLGRRFEEPDDVLREALRELATLHGIPADSLEVDLTRSEEVPRGVVGGALSMAGLPAATRVLTAEVGFRQSVLGWPRIGRFTVQARRTRAEHPHRERVEEALSGVGR